MRLSPVLTTRDLDIAELSSLRLLGVLRAVGESWVAAGEPLTLETRADVVAATLAPRLIADRWTAAWVWGATRVLQTPYDSCVCREPRRSRPRRTSNDRDVQGSGGRDRWARNPSAADRTMRDRGAATSVVPLPRTGVREIALHPDEIESVRGLRLTSPRRTAIDLLREAPEASDWSDAVIALLDRSADSLGELHQLREAMTDQRFATRAAAATARADQIEARLTNAAGSRPSGTTAPASRR
ncbi:hypothetical protein [Naasia lichenicola]|uniref:AbiEi antitoxin C-terminal domain-containing protein n=1 Tax=Naasia lichenicola TaxID=2565933 RepID=A0A4S4FRN3_9MICO|nr:hypothetical protein [Naasia lichenicola]THG33034.1 hypothetical protein E6C64_01330 [Naasia lichenicola]